MCPSLWKGKDVCLTQSFFGGSRFRWRGSKFCGRWTVKTMAADTSFSESWRPWWKYRRTASLPLDSYYLKTAFLHCIKKRRRGLGWASGDALGKYFLNILETLRIDIERRSLLHYRVPGSNFLDDFKEEVVKQMANRLRKIMESEERLNQILG